MRWRTVSRETLDWHEFDHELVVRSAHSGSTHLLQPLAGAVLKALLGAHESGLRAADLAARLCEDAPGEPLEKWTSAIEAVLNEFHRLGLAEPLPA